MFRSSYSDFLMKFSYTKNYVFILLWTYFEKRTEPPISYFIGTILFKGLSPLHLNKSIYIKMVKRIAKRIP